MPPADDPTTRARETALLLLNRRAMSARELTDALRRKGIDADTADAVVAEMTRHRYIDDPGFAETLCTEVLRRAPAAAALLEQRLRRRGIDADTARSAAEGATAGVDEVEVAEGLARRQIATMGGVDRSTVLRRVAGRLARRGFDEETVRTVVARLGLDEETP